MKVKDILLLNLEEDIKNVIDLEDHSEAEIQAEIDSYIVTDNLGEYYSKFAEIYSSNIKETGVWLSGFYGSGKSYFGKMLGYLLENKTIGGTPFNERFLPRFAGIKNEDLIKNNLGRLQRYKSLVVFLDVAKQNTANGLSYTLFKNFLKTLGFLDNEYGFIEYELFIGGEYDTFLTRVKETTGNDWKNIRTNLLNIEPGIKKALIGWKFSEMEYNNTLSLIREMIAGFSSNILQEMIAKYLDKHKDVKIIFLFDEASEAISQNKFNLLDLEGLSESLSSLGGHVWTIAIAQEKLDDVINNTNVSKAQLTKVTDRFKTKIHLEATEVDVIIKQRLLKKKEPACKELMGYYKKHSGKINDLTGLNAPGIEKTGDENTFAVYYPFHKYQFTLLQNFLFGTKGLASSKVAARGMIITTFDVLRRQILNEELYKTATAYALCSEAQPQPPARLVNRYDNANQILQNEGSPINGRKLLETIHFLSEAEIVPVTLENITKSYIANAEDYHKAYEDIKIALEILSKTKILLVSNNIYKITSDLEQRLIDEMLGYPVELFFKRKYLVDVLKKSSSIKNISKVQYNGQPFDFYLITDQDDEIVSSSNKNIKVTMYNIYNVDSSDVDFIDKIKAKTGAETGVITIIPGISEFAEMDKCIIQIKQISFLEEKYSSSTDGDVKKIVRDFQAIKEEKEKRLSELIDAAYQNSTLVNLYNVYQVNSGTFKTEIYNRQVQVIQNIYTRGLKAQLGDDIAVRVIKESNPKRLHSYYNGEEFKFFDSAGNFIGDSLKVTEEILLKIRNTYVDGKTIEMDLIAPPTGFSYGTVASTTAALFRAGKVIAKFNGEEKFSYNDPGVGSIFENSRNFGKASFKAIIETLTAKQKQEIVDALISDDVQYKTQTGQNIDYNTNDFELANAPKKLADLFIARVDAHQKTIKDFDILFKNIQKSRDDLAVFTGTVNDSNYIERAKSFIANIPVYKSAIKSITKAETFLKNNFEKTKTYRRFVEDILLEYDKCDATPKSFMENYTALKNIMDGDIVAQFSEIQNFTQKIKDEYFNQMKVANTEMSMKHTDLKKKAEELVNEIKQYPPEINVDVLARAQKLVEYAAKRINKEIDLEFDVKCRNCGLTLSEMKNAIALIPNYTESIMLMRYDIKKETNVSKKKIKKTITHHPFPHIMIAGEYRIILNKQIEEVRDLAEDDDIEIVYKG